ncbi:hypothetical protein AGMMS50293_21550 [Spirochaetia bacterium]|nr:hypothetical protein AGMMS50293_21550 [Spirochaetia bacterium]
MKYTDEQLREAVKNNIFTQEQMDSFKLFIRNSSSQVSKLMKLLYYGGGFLIISAMTWLIGSSLSAFGYGGIVAFVSIYFVVFLIAGYIVFFKNHLEIAGGILFSVSIALIPLLVFSILKLCDFWDAATQYDDFYIWIKGKFIVLELSAIAIAIPILLKTKFPFIFFLISFALWFLSMDIVPILIEETKITWTERAIISRIFGFAMIIIGYLLDIKYEKDYSFWLYLFGLLTLTAGFSVFYNSDDKMFIILGVIHIVMIFVSILLDRNVFLVFGTIGVIELLGRLSYEYFKGIFLFPFCLTIIGVLLICFGVCYQKNKEKIYNFVENKIPKLILNIRPKRARS